jgi:putative nucleotidyltransferase with HDIG domain
LRIMTVGINVLAGVLNHSGAAEIMAELSRVSPVTEAHCRRVGVAALKLADKLDLEVETTLAAGVSGALHDIGKGHPSLYRKIESPEQFSELERQNTNARHCFMGAYMIRALEMPTRWSEIMASAAYVAQHHHDSTETLAQQPPEITEQVELTKLVQVLDIADAINDSRRRYKRYWANLEKLPVHEVIHRRLGSEASVFGQPLDSVLDKAGV